MPDIPLPFFVTAESPTEEATTGFAIVADTQFGEFAGANTNARALAVFASIDDAQRFANGRFNKGMAIPIRTTTNAIEFLGEIKEKCGITHLLVDDGSHSTTRKALPIIGVLDSLRSTFGNN